MEHLSDNDSLRFYTENKEFWENAVNKRHSCRSFQDKPVDADIMEELKLFASSMKLPFEHNFELRFFKTDGQPIANNLKFAPPDCAAFLSETDLLSIGKTGFAGELFILYATGLGVDTCWFGHYKLSEVERLMPHLSKHTSNPLPSYGYGKDEVEGKRVICITPLGYWEQKGLRLMDRLAGSMMSFKRKPISELMVNSADLEKLPNEILYALDLARKAPSAGNTQHWRFEVLNGNKTVIIAKPKGYKHFKWEHCDMDVGICACHFWLGLQVQNIACTVEPVLDGDRVAWKFML